jgi:DhnA family fructose-bisphosphate aldolase class Ia
MGNGRVSRPALAELGLNTGKKARLHRILYQHGLRNGTAMFLPYDQGLEHGPRDFFDNPAAGDPAYIVKLAVEGVPKGCGAEVGEQEAVNAVVRSAARTPVLLSGGEKGGDEEVLDKARMAMEAGALGVIFGRNVWQRRYEESLRFIERLRELLSKYPS